MSNAVSNAHIQDLIKAGERFTSGQFDEAMAISSRVLEQSPGNADALHILGLSYLNLGKPAEAEHELIKATTSRKSDGGIANSLALARLALDDVNGAASALEKLAKKGKLPAEGLTTLGDCRLRQEEPLKARACFEAALKIKPDLPAALVNLGEALKELELFEEATQHYENVTLTQPEIASVWRNYGILLQELEQFSDSVSALEKYVSLRPSDPVGLKSLGYSYFLSSEFEKSLAAFDAASQFNEHDVEVWNNRGLVYRTLNRLDDAREAFNKALSIDPNFNAARLNLAHLVHDMEGPDPAIALIREALVLEPERSKAHLQLSEVYLIEGRMAEGWEEYGWRYKKPPAFAGFRDHPFLAWTGEDLSSKTILAWSEQGIGDEILYSGLLPQIIDRAKHVVVEIEPRLKPILERSFPSVSVVARTYPADRQLKSMDIDCQISLCEAVPILRPTREAFPSPSPYLSCDQDLSTTLRQKYLSSKLEKRLVGIAWSSNREKVGWLKSIPLQEWIPILSQSNTTFVSLQYGEHHQEISDTSLMLNAPIIEDQSIDSLKDMDSYFAQIAAMDLVITNSNTAAHVAGALGVPAWVMVPRLGTGILHWYWFSNGSDSPWYDKMKIYRQQDWHSWSKVIENVSHDLSVYLGGATS